MLLLLKNKSNGGENTEKKRKKESVGPHLNTVVIRSEPHMVAGKKREAKRRMIPLLSSVFRTWLILAPDLLVCLG